LANEPSWDEIFRPADTGASGDTVRTTVPPASYPAPASGAPGVPMTRREMREAEGYVRSGSAAPPQGPTQNSASQNAKPSKPKKKRRLGWLWALLTVLVLGIGAAATAWFLFEDQVREVLGWQEPIDYVGSGNGQEVLVTIVPGDIGEDIAHTLADSGVTMTFDAFYDLLLGMETQPNFTPGTYALQKEMSAQSALDALLDQDNRRVSEVALPEGITLPSIYERLSAGTEIPVADFEAAAADLASFGLPADAVSLEGYLFPATYEFEPGLTAHDILQQLVNRTFQSLDAAGVPVEQRNQVLTIASMIQREARISDDFYKVSRVIQNRLAQGMRMEFDSTAHYGANSQTGSVFTSDEERAAVNDYNTYVIPGLPIGPISAPGDVAIDAAMHPVDGTWLFFVTINLDTGETVFSNTVREHDKAVDQLHEWCRGSDVC
jgi:UPF0755 protein